MSQPEIRCIGCLAKPNGNTQLEPVEVSDGHLGIKMKSYPPMLGLGVILGIRFYAMLSLLGVSCPMVGAYTICMEMSWSGAKAITVPIILVRK